MILRVAAVAIVLLLGSVGSRPANATDGGYVDRGLAALAQQQPDSLIKVIILSRRIDAAAAALRQVAGTLGKPLPYVAALAAEVRGAQIEVLARQPGIVRVMLDPPMRLVQAGGPTTATTATSVFAQTVGAPALWSGGRTGRGVGIAVLDSGIQAHMDFGTPTRIMAARRFNNRAASAADQLGHGTWVAGIAAGGGTASDGRFTGIAPGASIINLKVTDETGAAYASDVIEALGWLVANRAVYDIRVANLSFVSGAEEGYATNLLNAAVEFAWHAGVVVVVSAGNQGADTLRAAPANDPYVITVGASDDLGTSWPGDDTLAWFSSFGTTQDRFAKPDLVAPGRHIVGPLASPGSALALQFPTNVNAQRYIQLSGTSASAPVVAGGIALLLEAHPALRPDQVKWLITSSARPLAGVPPGSGAGQLALAAAAELATGSIGRANVGLTPNRLVALAYLAQLGQPAVSWDSVSWDSVSWDSVSWDSVSWDSVSWDSVTSNSVNMDRVLGND